MTKRKALTATERAAEIATLDLRPAGEASRRTKRLLRTMLNTAPDPRVKKTVKRAKK